MILFKDLSCDLFSQNMEQMINGTLESNQNSVFEAVRLEGDLGEWFTVSANGLKPWFPPKSRSHEQDFTAIPVSLGPSQ